MQSPQLFCPSTPVSKKRDYTFAHTPQTSSPLASAPTTPQKTSMTEMQTRRRSQYKSRPVASQSTPRGRRTEPRGRSAKPLAPLNFGHSSEPGATEEAPRTAFLRERLKARCMERAQQDRRRKLNRKRGFSSEPSSDGFDIDMDDEEDEDEEAMFNDELFSRIMTSLNHKRQHQYRLSYAAEVGSSFDPDMEDVAEWENELKDIDTLGVDPNDLEEEEFTAYAEEHGLHLDDLTVDDIFGLSDLDETDLEHTTYSEQGGGGKHEIDEEDIDMDL